MTMRWFIAERWIHYNYLTPEMILPEPYTHRVLAEAAAILRERTTPFLKLRNADNFPVRLVVIGGDSPADAYERAKDIDFRPWMPEQKRKR